MSLDHEEYVERVLQCVETIPRGRVSTYGAIAEVVGELLGGGGPRLVGSTMAQHGGGVAHHDPAQPGRICPVEARLAGHGLKLAGLEHDGGARAGADHHAGGRSGAVEDVSKRDLTVSIHGIGLQRDRSRQGGAREQQRRRGEDQRPHDFTCALTDSIWSAVVMTLEFIS